MEFSDYLTMDSIAQLFGADPAVFGIFVAVIFGVTEWIKANISWFDGPRTMILPFGVGIVSAFLVPSQFSVLQSVRFGAQGAVASILVFMIGKMVVNGFTTVRRVKNGNGGTP